MDRCVVLLFTCLQYSFEADLQQATKSITSNICCLGSISVRSNCMSHTAMVVWCTLKQGAWCSPQQSHNDQPVEARTLDKQNDKNTPKPHNHQTWCFIRCKMMPLTRSVQWDHPNPFLYSVFRICALNFKYKSIFKMN